MAFADLIAAGKKPVIVQLLPALDTGGVEQGVVDLNAEIVKAGGRSIVVSSGGKRVGEITAAGGKHIALPVHSKNPLVILANIRRLRDVIRAEKVDILHACSRAPAWSALYAVRGTGAKFVTSCHSAHKITGAIKRWYNSSITRGARVIAVSEYLADYLRGNYAFDHGRLRVIHRGISLAKFDRNAVTAAQMDDARKSFGIPDGGKVLILPARLTRSKGHQFTLAALKELARRDFTCLFLTSNTGTSGFKSELEEDIRRAGLSDHIRIG
ncbi:MAG TPA: glycosyltransferase, partial [Patescibacteria group bacterium]|nr:glycosyltransferase [Patescibacteria group bacterium]